MEGSKLVEQRIGGWFHHVSDNYSRVCDKACVMGTIIYYDEIVLKKNLLCNLNYNDCEAFKQTYNNILNLKCKNPVRGDCSTVYFILMDLNDTYGWSREKIAEWLKEVEEYYDEKNKLEQINK